MVTAKFFDEIREQSQVKAEIVEKYFDTWAGIITATQDRNREKDPKIGYVDLFAGPGRYRDGATSTPLRIVQKAIEKPQYAERLVTIFNDKDEANARSLEAELSQLRGYEKLKHKPKIWNKEVGSEIAEQFDSINTIPLLAFIDPWGYKGLSLKLVQAFLKGWGCDCIFFFNYSRINAGLSNPAVQEHMEALFGEERAAKLSALLDPMAPATREATIVNELALALKEHASGNRFVLPFAFRSETGTRTTHHLILVTKHFKGYDVMKQIMGKASSSAAQGVPSFVFSPAVDSRQQLLFQLNRPLDDLEAMLLTDFAGRSVRMRDIYASHSVDRPYLAKNYKQVLRSLEAAGKIGVSNRRSKVGFADDLVAVFPPRR